MSADWMTCRVVRQEDAGLFFRTEDAPVNAGGPTWRAQNGESWTTRDLCELLPLTPVLDADGLPTVTTVGDLTARHAGRRVRVEGWGETVFREVFSTESGARCLFADGDHEFAATLDISCEVLP